MAKAEGHLMTTTLTLTVRQFERLRQIAGREYLAGRNQQENRPRKPSVSAVVRRAVDKYLDGDAA